jgi:hypothetical protein
VAPTKEFDHDKATDKELAEHQRRLQFDTDVDVTPAESDTPERFLVRDELRHDTDSTKGLPKDAGGLQRSIADPNLVVELVGDRQWRRTYKTDETGLEVKGSEEWVEVTRRGGTELPLEDAERGDKQPLGSKDVQSQYDPFDPHTSHTAPSTRDEVPPKPAARRPKTTTEHQPAATEFQAAPLNPSGETVVMRIEPTGPVTTKSTEKGETTSPFTEPVQPVQQPAVTTGEADAMHSTDPEFENRIRTTAGDEPRAVPEKPKPAKAKKPGPATRKAGRGRSTKPTVAKPHVNEEAASRPAQTTAAKPKPAPAGSTTKVVPVTKGPASG